MGKGTFGEFTDLTAVDQSDPVDVSHLETVYVVGFGTFVGTWELQFTMDDLGGTPNWHTHPTITGKTGPFNGELGFRARGVRLACTAFTSGTIEGRYSGNDEDAKG